MTKAASKIGIHCTPVPDGITKRGKARLSLVLTPDVRPGQQLKDLSLESWPKEICDFAKNKQLLICFSGAKIDSDAFAAPIGITDPVFADSGEANRLWLEIFRPQGLGYDGLDYLYKALQQNVQLEPNSDGRSKALDEFSKALTAAPTAGPETPLFDALNGQPIQTVTIGKLKIAPASLNWVDTQYLDAALNGFHDDSQLLTLLALLTAQEQRSKDAASASRLLAAMARAAGQQPNAFLGDTLVDILGGTTDNAVNWINAVAAAFANRPFRQRILGSLQDTVLQHLLEASLGNPADDAFGRLKSLQKMQKQAEPARKRRVDIEKMLRYAHAQVAPDQVAAKPNFVQSRRDGIDMMRALFKEAVRQHAQQRAVGPSSPNAGFRLHKATASDSFDKFHRHWHNAARAISSCENDDETQRDEAARRKFFGIRALPTLAKFLRLTVDIELDPSVLEEVDASGTRRPYDLVTAFFVDDPKDHAELDKRIDAAAWTGFETIGTAQERILAFRPASFKTHRLGHSAPELKTAPPIKNGVVDLRGSLGDSRFMITILDLPAAVGSMRVKAEQDSGSQRDGTMLDTVSSKVTQRQSRGLQLIDNYAAAKIASDVVTSWRADTTKPAGDKLRPNFAEDLAIGYRPYIQRSRLGGKVDQWRSLVARGIKIDQIAPFVGSFAYRELRVRDHGYVMPAHKVLGDAPSTDGQMFAWMGASLALSKEMDGSTDYTDGPGPGHDSEHDLALDITYGFLPDRDQDALLPALRVGDSYMMGLSPVYPNGGGSTFAEAKRAFDPTVTLGDANKPFKFGPPRDIPPPELLMSEAEAKLWQKTEDSKTADRGNAENIVRIVLRSATIKPADNKDNVKRYLVPPRANFEVAEQSGMFDRVFDSTPMGAFNDYEQDRTVGGFTSDDPPSTEKTPPPQHQRSRSPVLRPAGYAPPEAPYYPDPLARNLKVAFERGGATPAGFPDAVPLKEFWKQGASPITAKPIELLVKRSSGAREGGQIDFGDTTARVNGLKFATSRVLERLTIEIAPAEEVNLRLWCVPDLADLLRSHAVMSAHFQSAAMALVPQMLTSQKIETPQSAAGAQAPVQKSTSKTSHEQFSADSLSYAIGLVAQGLSAEHLSASAQPSDVVRILPTVRTAFDTMFSALTSQTPENGLNAWLTVKVIHAVEQPLAVPSVPCNAKSRDANKLAIQAVRVQQNTPWQEYTADAENYYQPADGSAAKVVTPSDPASPFGLLSQDKGATAYFVGQIEIDRASTGEVRIEASWPETDPESAIRVVKPAEGSAANEPKKYKLDPLKKDRALFSIKVPRDRGLNPEGQLDLTFDETGVLRSLNYPFTNTIAREISLRIVATSRFAGDFPAAPKKSEPPNPYVLSRFEVESRPPMGSSRLDQARAHPESYREYKIIVPATAPPATPVISRLDWVMPETLTDFDPGRRVSVEKNFYPRLYIGQDWCGTDDLVAVVCAPADLVSYRPLSIDGEAHKVLEPVPLSTGELLNAPMHRNIPASSFTDTDGKYAAIAEDVSRWGSDSSITSGALTGTITRERFSGFVATRPNVPLPGKNSGNVSVVLYKPIFDECAGEFYIDIGIDPAAAHSPVVQLVVARYQPHVTKQEFHLSAVARVKPFQIAPKRKVEVMMHGERNITAIVRGVGYTDRLPEIPASLMPTNPMKPPKLPDKYAGRMKYPLQNIRVVRLTDDNATTGLQVHNESGQALSVRRIEPQFDHPELIWIAEFNLPVTRTKIQYGLHFEEIDLHFADEAYEAGQDPDMHLIDRLSVFSLTVDLERGLYSPIGKKDQISSTE
jgi:hypothetical protein